MCNENLEQVKNEADDDCEKYFNISLLRGYATIITETCDLAISQFDNHPKYGDVSKVFGQILLLSDSEIPELLSKIRVD